MAALNTTLLSTMKKLWYEENRANHVDRCGHVSSRFASHLLAFASERGNENSLPNLRLDQLVAFEKAVCEDMQSWVTDSAHEPDVCSGEKAHVGGLGRRSDALYRVVRDNLGVPFHKGLGGEERTAVGTHFATACEAIGNETIMDALLRSCSDLWSAKQLADRLTDRLAERNRRKWCG